MKKLLFVGLAMLGTAALTGCDAIQGLISGEKQYNYNDFKALLADRKLSFDATKCTASIDEDGSKSTIEYKYDLEDKIWRYTQEEDGVTYNGTEVLDVTGEVKTYELSAALAGVKNVDDAYKFYATSNSYRIVLSYSFESLSMRVEGEYKYREDGLKTDLFEKTTDLDAIKTSEKKVKYSYSK